MLFSDLKPAKIRKKKSSKKSAKHSSKVKRKKISKSKEKIAVVGHIVDDLNIKEEPVSDEENIDHNDDDFNIDDEKKSLKKIRKQRKKISTSFIK